MAKEDDPDNRKDDRLEWRDYIAFTIAAFETILLPLVVFVVLLLILVLIIR